MHPVSDKTILLSLLNRNIPFSSTGNIDWENIFAIADYSRVTALLFNCIKDRRKNIFIPDDIYSKLKREYQLNTMRNLLLLDELDRLHDVLKSKGIPFILLKGIGLVNTVYSSAIGTRKMTDIDIMVKESDVEKIDSVFKDLGYHLPPADIGYVARMKQARKAVMYFKRKSEIEKFSPIHLHWHPVNISRPFFETYWTAVDMDEIWNEARQFWRDDDVRLLLGHEHSVIFFAVHAFSHGFSRIDMIYDLHSYITAYDRAMDWTKIKRLAKQWRVELPLRMGLVLSKRMFDTPVPETIFGDLYPKRQSMIEMWCQQYAFTNSKPREDINALLYYAHSDGVAGKLNFLKSVFTLKLLPSEN